MAGKAFGGAWDSFAALRWPTWWALAFLNMVSNGCGPARILIFRCTCGCCSSVAPAATALSRTMLPTISGSPPLFSSHLEAYTDACFTLPGPWQGTTELSYVIQNQTYHCQYATKIAFSTPVSDRSHFTAEMLLQRNSTACFLSPQLTLTGFCNNENGEIQILTKDANLNGITDGQHMNLEGTMNIRILLSF